MDNELEYINKMNYPKWSYVFEGMERCGYDQENLQIEVSWHDKESGTRVDANLANTPGTKATYKCVKCRNGFKKHKKLYCIHLGWLGEMTVEDARDNNMEFKTLATLERLHHSTNLTDTKARLEELNKLLNKSGPRRDYPKFFRAKAKK